MNKRIEGLLSNISNIVKTYEKKNATTGDSINLLSIARIENDEKIICRILAFLLNPKEKHYQKDNFLKLFLEEINELPASNDEAFDVFTEYPTDNKRRIDIVIRSEKRFIPIEVKVYAEDQEYQCHDYYIFAQKSRGSKVFYLTPDGHEPSTTSKEGLIINETLKLLSFRKEISNWLLKCERIVPEENKPLKELIREFRMTVNKFNNIMGDKEMQKEILDEIINTNNEEAALAIESAIKTIDGNILWDEFCNKMIENNSIGLDFFNDQDLVYALSVNLDSGITIDFNDKYNMIDIIHLPDVSTMKNKLLELGYEVTEKNKIIYINKYKNHSLFYYFTGLERPDENKLKTYRLFTKDAKILEEKMKKFIELINSNI